MTNINDRPVIDEAALASIIAMGMTRDQAVLVAESAWEITEAIEPMFRALVAERIRAVAADRTRKRPLRKDAQTPSDFADDMEWAAMIAEGSA